MNLPIFQHRMIRMLDVQELLQQLQKSQPAYWVVALRKYRYGLIPMTEGALADSPSDCSHGDESTRRGLKRRMMNHPQSRLASQQQQDDVRTAWMAAKHIEFLMWPGVQTISVMTISFIYFVSSLRVRRMKLFMPAGGEFLMDSMKR